MQISLGWLMLMVLLFVWCFFDLENKPQYQGIVVKVLLFLMVLLAGFGRHIYIQL